MKTQHAQSIIDRINAIPQQQRTYEDRKHLITAHGALRLYEDLRENHPSALAMLEVA